MAVEDEAREDPFRLEGGETMVGFGRMQPVESVVSARPSGTNLLTAVTYEDESLVTTSMPAMTG